MRSPQRGSADRLSRNVPRGESRSSPDMAQLERWYVGHMVELIGAGIRVPDLRDQAADRAGSAEA